MKIHHLALFSLLCLVPITSIATPLNYPSSGTLMSFDDFYNKYPEYQNEINELASMDMNTHTIQEYDTLLEKIFDDWEKVCPVSQNGKLITMTDVPHFNNHHLQFVDKFMGNETYFEFRHSYTDYGPDAGSTIDYSYDLLKYTISDTFLLEKQYAFLANDLLPFSQLTIDDNLSNSKIADMATQVIINTVSHQPTDIGKNNISIVLSRMLFNKFNLLTFSIFQNKENTSIDLGSEIYYKLYAYNPDLAENFILNGEDIKNNTNNDNIHILKDSRGFSQWFPMEANKTSFIQYIGSFNNEGDVENGIIINNPIDKLDFNYNAKNKAFVLSDPADNSQLMIDPEVFHLISTIITPTGIITRDDDSNFTFNNVQIIDHNGIISQPKVFAELDYRNTINSISDNKTSLSPYIINYHFDINSTLDIEQRIKGLHLNHVLLNIPDDIKVQFQNNAQNDLVITGNDKQITIHMPLGHLSIMQNDKEIYTKIDNQRAFVYYSHREIHNIKVKFSHIKTEFNNMINNFISLTK